MRYIIVILTAFLLSISVQANTWSDNSRWNEKRNFSAKSIISKYNMLNKIKHELKIDISLRKNHHNQLISLLYKTQRLIESNLIEEI